MRIVRVINSDFSFSWTRQSGLNIVIKGKSRMDRQESDTSLQKGFVNYVLILLLRRKLLDALTVLYGEPYVGR